MTQPTLAAPTPPPAPVRHRRHRPGFKAIALGALVAAVVFGLGVAAGQASTTAKPAAATQAAAPETKTVTVEKAPQACLDALDEADDGFALTVKTLGLAQEGFEAVSRLDVDGMNAIIPKLDAITEDLNAKAPTYQADKAACRAAG